MQQRRLRKLSNLLRTQRYLVIRAADLGAVNANSFSHIRAFYTTLTRDVHSDGNRFRAYVALHRDPATGFWIADRSVISYSQPVNVNPVDGGKERTFGAVPDEILEQAALQAIIEADVSLALKATFASLDNVIVELHFIRYSATGRPTWGSPLGLHADNEVLVFVHLIDLHRNLIGGDNIIANDNFVTPEQVVQLVAPLDTLVLAHQKVHSVTPMQARRATQRAHRDVLLVTFKPRIK